MFLTLLFYVKTFWANFHGAAQKSPLHSPLPNFIYIIQCNNLRKRCKIFNNTFRHCTWWMDAAAENKERKGQRLLSVYYIVTYTAWNCRPTDANPTTKLLWVVEVSDVCFCFLTETRTFRVLNPKKNKKKTTQNKTNT